MADEKPAERAGGGDVAKELRGIRYWLGCGVALLAVLVVLALFILTTLNSNEAWNATVREMRH